MTTPMGVGVLGLDHWYNAMPFLQQLKENPDFRLVAIAHTDAERARVVAEEQDATATSDFEAVLDNPAVQVIATFVSTERNAGLCIEAADRGKHVMSIKPIAMTRSEARQVLDKVEAKSVVFFPGESAARLTAVYQYFKRWLEEGRIGTLRAISCSHDASIPRAWPDSREWGWWTDANRTPGGGWIDHSIYQIDFIRWLTGASVERIEGEVGNVLYSDLDLEDYGNATLLMSNGTIASSRAHWLATDGGFRRVMEIVGSEGTILFDSSDNRVRVKGHFDDLLDGGEQKPTALTPGWTGTALPTQGGTTLLAHVKKVIAGEVDPIATATDGLLNLSACLDFYRSAKRVT